MAKDDEAEDGFAWGVVPRLAGGAVAVPVVAAFVALGAGVMVVRSVRDVARHAWGWLPGQRNGRTPRIVRRAR